MFCPNCGTRIPEGDRFCEQCGELVLPEDAKGNESGKTEILDEEIIVDSGQNGGNQGIIIPDINMIPEEKLEPEPKNRSRKVVLIILLILAMISGGLGFAITNILDDGDSEVQEQTETEMKEYNDEVDFSEEEKMEAEAASHVIAGRGTAGEYDTIEGLQSWVNDGARMIEQDVRMSLDGTLYICHEEGVVEGMPDRSIYSPELRDAFEEFRDNEDVIFVVELKTKTYDMAEAFIDLVKEYGYEDRVIAQSFDADVLKPVSKAFPDMEIIYLINVNNASKGQPTLNEALSIDFITTIAVDEDKAGMMTTESCRMVKDSGKKFGAFVLYDTSSIKKAIDMDVDYYFISGEDMTPRVALRLEENRGK